MSTPQPHDRPGASGPSASQTGSNENSPAADEVEPRALDRTQPQMTLRAALTGVVLGAILSTCNIYMGMKIGVGLNIAVTAALLSYGFWIVMRRVSAGRVRPWGLLENNITVTTCAAAAAAVSSAGLVAPIPALAIMVPGWRLSWYALSLWVFSVCLVGITVAIPLRRQMLLREKLPFAFGVATAETLREMYAQGREAVSRVVTLVGAACAACASKLIGDFAHVSPLGLPFSIGGYSAGRLSLAFEPQLLFLGVGGLIGLRAGAALLLGALLAYGVLAPPLIRGGQTPLRWLMWPGVTLMVVSSLVSFGFSWRTLLAALPRWHRKAAPTGPAASPAADRDEVGVQWFVIALVAALLLAVVLQMTLFRITWWVAVLGVVLSFLLAIVAARVSGETGVAPVGPMGKVTQFVFGVVSPKNAAANLMTANVTGGAASQCAELLQDLKCGYLLGASPKWQTLAQTLGALAGSVAGSALYLIMFPRPAEQLLTREWPAPAVVSWKAVAELFQTGLGAFPPGALTAVAFAAVAGVVLPILEQVVPKNRRWLVPSAASMGLAFILPGFISISLFMGGLIAWMLGRLCPSWSKRFLITVCAGIVAGESLTGVGQALFQIVLRRG